ncbi:MAG: ATP-dependent DNA helicase RecG [Parcubacteria group bacterium]|nr:ATP-dependent DNA helicase RecG [Parcubacteria group bacterium]
MLTLETKISSLGRIGKVASKYLKKLDIETTKDLIFYYPWRYDDLSKITLIKDLQPWMITTLKCRVNIIENHRSKIKKTLITEAIVSDDTGKLKIIWFNQPFIVKILKGGDYVYLSGKVDADLYGMQMTGPVYEKVTNREPTHTARVVPVYSLTGRLSQKQIRFLIKSILNLAEEISDIVPDSIKKILHLWDLPNALKETHFPTSLETVEEARRRLKFDELFILAIRNELTRNELKKSDAPKIEFFEEKTRTFVNELPFKLTDGQRTSAWEILKDIGSEGPMNRLLDGDVGSGKTVVAAIAMLNVFLSEYQSALMVPTEILALQHFESLTKLFKNLDVKIGLLTHSFSLINTDEDIRNDPSGHHPQGGKIPHKNLIEEIIVGGVDIIIGTHALIQEKVKFKNLALAVIDEQHRFGVKQRAEIKKKANLEKGEYQPHLLSMTATPIPRTLMLSAYGDLDISIINELPKERLPIISKVVRQERRNEVYKFIRDEINKGRQAFVICPLIDPSDKLGVKSVTEEYKKLNETIFKDLEIGLMHGKLKSAEKEKVMADFLANKTKILVSTSVVEVGVDVPSASIMLIEGAERFGLAQLHQFRGRIGRDIHQSYCFVVQENFSEVSTQRLQVFEQCRNGFDLAEKDLEFRGQGDIFGTRQSGKVDFQIANITDVEIMKQARDSAQELIKKDPELTSAPLLKEKLEEFSKNVHLE